MTDRYSDIIGLPHHVSDKHPQMSLRDRAAQFSPFAALTGYEAAIKETARTTQERVELDDGARQELNDRLQIIADHLTEQPRVTITYFQPDRKKSGGEYLTTNGIISKVDGFKRIVVLFDGLIIPMDEIKSIDSDLLGRWIP